MDVRKLFLNILSNSLLIIFLILTIQNSNHRNSVNLIFFKTISLPLSFILGSSFISGSICGGILQSIKVKTPQ
tara:strand:+ start:994 stop:1212 length:219 start_codon:yes stop_codon:yes gene_type:complete